MSNAKIRKAARDIVWMLANTITEGEYETRPTIALKIWQTEENTTLTEAEEKQILALIEW